MIRVLLADDHSIVLEGLQAVLKEYDDIQVCGEAQNGEEVIAFLKERSVDVVVLDINMPKMDGIACARWIRKMRPNVKIIVLTMYAQKSFVEEIIKIGIHGCLLKNNTGKELKDAILRVSSGRSYYDLIQTYSDTEEVERYKLSEREIQVIKLLAEGLNSQQISDKLFIAEHTVKTHRKNILKKLNLHNTSQLFQFAINNQII
jgi:DNA-binding NarL/FixJ family response regulator